MKYCFALGGLALVMGPTFVLAFFIVLICFAGIMTGKI